MNLNIALTNKLIKVIDTTAFPFKFFENRVQIIGRYNGTPVNAPKLITTFTIPPIVGMIKAIPMAKIPKPMVDILATFIKVSSFDFGANGLKISFVNTPADIFKVAFNELAVTKIIPPNIKPNKPEGMAALHMSK